MSIKSFPTLNRIGVMIMGGVGCGKTSALSVLFDMYCDYLSDRLEAKIKNIEADNFPSYYEFGYNDFKMRILTHWDLIRHLRDVVEMKAVDKTKDKVAYFSENILVIDDLGRAYDDKSGWNIALQEELFDFRWRNCLPTFITSNYGPEQLREWKGWERIIDRIGDNNWIKAYTISGKSKR